MYKIYLLGLSLCFIVFSGYSQKILTLSESLSVAGTQSPDLRESLLNLQRTQESLNASRASLKSQFFLNLTPIDYNQNRSFNDLVSEWYTTENFNSFGTLTVSQPILWTDGTLSLNNRLGWQNNYSGYNERRDKSFYNNLYINLNQPLFTYNRTSLEIQSLELDHENAMLSYAMQRLNLEKSVSQFFYDVYLAQMGLTIREEEYENTRKSHEIIENKVAAGLAAKEELYQSEVNLESARSTVENERVGLENAKDIFKQYIGMDIFESITVMADIDVHPIDVDEKKAIAYGLSSRMEIRQREINIETSQFDLIKTRSMNEFRGDMNLSIGLIGDAENLGNVYDNPTRNPQVNISFNVPLWDWGEKKARVRAQEAVVKSQELSLERQNVQIKIDIRKVIRNLQNLRNQIEIALKNEQNAQLTYDINLERYENGDLTSMDLNLFQTQLSDKKMAYAQSLINYRIELLNLKIQSLYDFELNEPIVPEEFFNEYRSRQK